MFKSIKRIKALKNYKLFNNSLVLASSCFIIYYNADLITYKLKFLLLSYIKNKSLECLDYIYNSKKASYIFNNIDLNLDNKQLLKAQNKFVNNVVEDKKLQKAIIDISDNMCTEITNNNKITNVISDITTKSLNSPDIENAINHLSDNILDNSQIIDSMSNIFTKAVVYNDNTFDALISSLSNSGLDAALGNEIMDEYTKAAENIISNKYIVELLYMTFVPFNLKSIANKKSKGLI